MKGNTTTNPNYKSQNTKLKLQNYKDDQDYQ